jgi:hypothetical protein
MGPKEEEEGQNVAQNIYVNNFLFIIQNTLMMDTPM